PAAEQEFGEPVDPRPPPPGGEDFAGEDTADAAAGEAAELRPDAVLALSRGRGPGADPVQRLIEQNGCVPAADEGDLDAGQAGFDRELSGEVQPAGAVGGGRDDRGRVAVVA